MTALSCRMAGLRTGVLILGLAGSLLVPLGCSNGSGSTSTTASGPGSPPNSNTPPAAGSTLSPYTAITGANTQPITVSGDFAPGYPNELLTSVTVCVPGTTTCQTIPNILVDTGSVGLRLISAQMTLPLPAVTLRNASLGECLEFVDSFVWGPVVTADVQLGNALAASVPIQIIGSPTFAAPPALCTSSGLPEQDTVDTLGANGILGVGLFLQDCGTRCTEDSLAAPAIYFTCPNTGAPCVSTAIPLAAQVQHPIHFLPQDNNGVIISLPVVDPRGAVSVQGTLVFGIGTASNNGLGNAQVYTTDADGTFTTLYHGKSYPGSFLDTGSSVLFLLDAVTLGLPLCGPQTTAPGDYCPAAAVSLVATTVGLNDATGEVAVSIANADSVLNSPNNAFNNVAAPFGARPEAFNWGLPFFFGRNVFVAIEDQATPAGVGPYWAY